MDRFPQRCQAWRPRSRGYLRCRWRKSGALWRRLYDREAPTHGRRFLEKRIAYKLQEIEFRKVNPEILERNRQRIEALMEAGQKKKPERGVRLLPGTVLTREYQGVEHRITVTLDGGTTSRGGSIRASR